MRIFLFVLFCFFNGISIHAQSIDTVSMYFETAKHKLNKNQYHKLKSLPKQLELEDIDSIVIIGLADTIGNWETNQKLSLKRAKSCHKIIAKHFPNTLPIRFTASGETNKSKQLNTNRRVDIFIHSMAYAPSYTPEEYPSNTLPICYNIDYEILHRSLIKKVRSKRKAVIRIIVEPEHLQLDKKHYRGHITNDSTWNYYPINWKLKTIGKKWWKSKRYVTEIPLSDYQNFKLFTISSPPCNDCGARFLPDSGKIKNYTCYKRNLLISNNIQYKQPLLYRPFVKFRIPKELVPDSSVVIPVGHGAQKLKLTTRKNKKHKDHYFGTLPYRYNYNKPDWSFVFVKTICCEKPSEDSLSDQITNKSTFLGYCIIPNQNIWQLGSQTGYLSSNTQGFFYSNLNFYRFRYHSLTGIQLGINNFKQPHARIFYDYSIGEFTLSFLKNFNKWVKPKVEKGYTKYFILYFGNDVLSMLKDESTFLSQNAYLGIRGINASKNTFFEYFFLQYGIGYSYLSSPGFTSYFNTGINLRLWKQKR